MADIAPSVQSTRARLPALIADVESALVVSRGQPSSVRHAANSCAADLYMLVRSVAKRLGRVDLSLLAADRAVRASEVTGDALRCAAARWNVAHVLLADGAPEAAETVAMNAAEKLRTPMVHGASRAMALYGALILLSAIAAVRNGDSWKARERVRQVPPIASRTGECNAYWTSFGPTNVAMYGVSIEVESGEAAEGLRLAGRVRYECSPSIERRVAFLVDRAKGFQQRRDFASALTLLSVVEREAPEDLQYRPAAHAVLRTVVERGRRQVATDASRLALRIGFPA